jgi:cobalt-zinc-cadmium resistance protein CzcA
MIEKIIRYSVENRVAVLIVSALLLFLGVYKASLLSIDALPDVTNVQVSIVTKAPGLSPSEVEQFITFPIELALNGLPDVNQIRSVSRTGVSSVTVIFKDEVETYFARQLVNERLRQAEADIPPGYGKPELSPVATALGDIYELILVSDRLNPEQLRTYLDWELGPKLKAIPGVIDINVFGGQLKQYQVIVDPNKLALHSLSLRELLELLKSANMNVGGGYIQKGPEQWVIRGEGQFKSLDDLKKLPVRTSASGTTLLLDQIATVRTGPALRFGAITRAGYGEVVGMTIIMLKGQNSRVVVNSVKDKVAELQKKLPEGMRIVSFYDRSEFIGRTLGTVFVNLSEGAFLVVAILFFAFGSFKGALLVGSAIPFSMLVAVIFMHQFGIVGNLMSLGAIDFGLLVDGAVVMLESVLAIFTIRGVKQSAKESILEGCTQVGRAAAFSVMIILLVYLPLMTLEGVEGKMFRPMAITVALALGAALLFTLTTFPAALAVLYKSPKVHHPHFWDKILKRYESILLKTQKNPKKLFISAGTFLIVSLLLGGTLGTEFLPRIDEGEIVVDIKRLPSTAIDYSKDLNERIEKVLIQFPEVLSVVSRTGRGESAAEPIGTEDGEIMVKLKKKSEWTTAKDLDSLMEKMKEMLLDRVPSTYISMSQPIEDRVNELIAGSKADVVVKIYGDDLQKLKELSEKFAERIKRIQGTGDLRVQRVLGLPMLEVKVNREKLARYGVQADEVLTAVQAFRVGADAGKVFEGLRRFDIALMLGVDASSIDAVENVPVMTSSGSTVPLGMVADIQKIEGPAVIYRETLKRRVFVEVNVRGRDLGSFVREAQAQTADLVKTLPEDYEVKWGGQFENFTRAKDRLLLVVPVIILIISGMLVFAFKNLRFALAVCSTIPLSLTGGILALFLRGMPFSIPAAVGFIALSGITVLTGVVYVTALKHLLQEGVPLRKAVIQAGINSARANMTTATIAAIGFLPMAISSGAGAEVQRPLATVVVGGMLTGTILIQLLLPEWIAILSSLRFDGKLWLGRFKTLLARYLGPIKAKLQ